jgi:hypothetical protein
LLGLCVTTRALVSELVAERGVGLEASLWRVEVTGLLE